MTLAETFDTHIKAISTAEEWAEYKAMVNDMSNAEEIASKNAVSYVKKHNFDEELLDFARACYYDGFIDAQAHTRQTLDKLKAKADKLKHDERNEIYESNRMYNSAIQDIITLIDEAINE